MFRKSVGFFLCVSGSAMVMVLATGGANAGMIGTYVDATTTNTTPGADITTISSDTDGLWTLRSFSGTEGGTVIEAACNGTGELCPTLTTTVSGLANGTYNVYGVYWVKLDTSGGTYWQTKFAVPGQLARGLYRLGYTGCGSTRGFGGGNGRW